jgi:PmbA protein
MSDRTQLLEMADLLLDEARKGGAEEAEVFLRAGPLTRTTYGEGEMSDRRDGWDGSLALTIWRNGCAGVATTNSPTPDAKALTAAAIGNARSTLRETPALLGSAESSFVAAELEPELATVEEQDRRLRELDAQLRSLRSTGLIGIEHRSSRPWTVLATSRGHATCFQSRMHTIWPWFDGPGGHMVEEAFGPRFADLDFDGLESRSRERDEFLTSGPGSHSGTGSTAAVLSPYVAAQLTRTISALLTADNVRRALPALLDRLGRPIASPAVTLVDDPTLPAALRSRQIDDEGTPARQVTLLEQGRLQGFLHTLQSATELGAEPNGAAARSQIAERAAALPSNVYLAPGHATLEELCERMGEGLIVTQALQRGQMHSETGRFAIAVQGWWVRNGRRTAVTGVRLSENVFRILRTISACADDVAFSTLAYGAGSPSLLLDRVDFA